ncbi:YpfB family protein [Bacillus sp. 03113]|uniref:YpfB family protein n=1 Tax=Bacillus sp. 03113 TaxID=2578211 RepID=UPI001144DCB6|nr:YpfB family protein [Bacillus sp. 03113]
MKTTERIILKITIVQFICLLLVQFFLYGMNAFPELKQITQFEGVTEQNFTDLIETFKELK